MPLSIPKNTKKRSPKSVFGEKLLNWKKEFSKKTQLPYLIFLGVFTFSLFSFLIYAQQKSLNATELLNDLVTSEKVMPLHDFSAQFHGDCQLQAGVQDCELISDLAALRLPNPEVISKHISTLTKTPRQVVLKHEFTEAERKWMHEKRQFSLVIAGNVQRVTQLRLADRTEVSAGVGANTAFALEENDFQNGRNLVIDVQFENLPWFGPADFPIAFTEINATGIYQELGAKNRAANSTGKQMQLAIPLILAVMAIFIGQKNIFGVVATFASLRAASIFFGFFVEERTTHLPALNFLFTHKDAIMGLLNGLCCASLLSLAFALAEDKQKIKFSSREDKRQRLERFRKRNFVLRALELVSHRVETETSSRVLLILKIVAFAFFGISFLIWADRDTHAWLSGDLFSDFIGGTLGALILAGVLAFYIKDELEFYNLENKKYYKTNESVLKERRLKFIFQLSKLTLALLAFLFLAYGNGQDLIVNTSGVKSIIQWTYAFLYPAVCVIAFLDVGASAILSSLQEPEIESKRELDKELLIAKQFQKLTHPPHRKTSKLWRWRIFHKPATQLSGDWFGIAELKFAGGQQMLLATVLDFSGHGIGPGLSAGIAAATFNEWVKEQQNKPIVLVTAFDKAQFVYSCVVKMDSALRQNNIGCAEATQIFVLVDPAQRNLVLLNGNHPSPAISDGIKTYKSIVQSGLGQLGAGVAPLSEKIFKVVPFHPGETLMLFSDGLSEVKEIGGIFTKLDDIRFAKNPFPLAKKAFDVARKTRALWRTHPEEFDNGLDDITIVCINLIQDKGSLKLRKRRKVKVPFRAKKFTEFRPKSAPRIAS